MLCSSYLTNSVSSKVVQERGSEKLESAMNIEKSIINQRLTKIFLTTRIKPVYKYEIQFHSKNVIDIESDEKVEAL
jgi:hypothetical protein